MKIDIETAKSFVARSEAILSDARKLASDQVLAGWDSPIMLAVIDKLKVSIQQLECGIDRSTERTSTEENAAATHTKPPMPQRSPLRVIRGGKVYADGKAIEG